MAGESELARPVTMGGDPPYPPAQPDDAAQAADDLARREGGLADELREGRAPPTIAAALIAWAVTLTPAAFGRGASYLAAGSGVLALACGIGGPLLARTRPRLGRHLGISLFLAFATLTWLAGSQAIHPLRLDSIRGAFGAVAWGVFALSWSDRWSSRAEPLPADPDAPLLLPRAALPPLAVPLATCGVAAAVVFLSLAFLARDPDRALVSQAAALACAVAVVTASATVATSRGKPRSSSGRRLTPPVVRALLLLVTVAIAGAVITALRY
jgi:hypothetical protein